MAQELVHIASGPIRAAISPFGAELWSLTDANGRPLMSDGDPRWWTGRAPLLFPFVGRCSGDRYRVDGRDYAMAQHGFARRMPFALAGRTGDSATFRLDADAATMAVYPFAFRLDMDFAVRGASLTMTALVMNRGTADMPFSFGYHPAFAWPLPFGGAADEHRIVFDTPEPAPIRMVGTEPGLIAPDPVASPVDGDTLSPTPAMFAGDALIWDRLESRSLMWGVPGRTRLKIDFPDTPWLGLWQKPGAPFLCVEPWAGMADPMGFTGDVWEKPGIMRLRPGEQRHFRMAVTLIDGRERM
ncbi:MAG: aldose 1-epimerase family protein [Sphingobium sp.]